FGKRLAFGLDGECRDAGRTTGDELRAEAVQFVLDLLARLGLRSASHEVGKNLPSGGEALEGFDAAITEIEACHHGTASILLRQQRNLESRGKLGDRGTLFNVFWGDFEGFTGG